MPEALCSVVGRGPAIAGEGLGSSCASEAQEGLAGTAEKHQGREEQGTEMRSGPKELARERLALSTGTIRAPPPVLQEARGLQPPQGWLGARSFLLSPELQW